MEEDIKIVNQTGDKAMTPEQRAEVKGSLFIVGKNESPSTTRTRRSQRTFMASKQNPDKQPA